MYKYEGRVIGVCVCDTHSGLICGWETSSTDPDEERLEYWDDKSQQASYVGCSNKRVEEYGFTLVYSYDRDTKLRLLTECVVTCEYLRDTF